MANTNSVDQDAVLRARVSPSAYRGKLATALVSYAYSAEFQGRPEIVLSLCGEAVEAARGMGAEEVRRTEVLVRALGAYERELFAAGRRGEGLAVCEEAAAVGREGFDRGQVDSAGYGSGRLAVVLAEEGRYAAAASVGGGELGASFWELVRHAGALEAAGSHGVASEVFGRVVDARRGELAVREGSLALAVWVLVHYARMTGTGGAGAVRAEALGLLKELSETGERRSRSDLVASWKTLLALSSRPLEPAGSPTSPAPAFGADLTLWSPDVRHAYFADLAHLSHTATAPSTPLAERTLAHHRLTIRSALRHNNRPHSLHQTLRPLFDHSITLSRQLPDPTWLTTTLTDRATFLIATHHHREAHTDLREATELLDGGRG
ncbi:hypothetical protein IAG44_29165 [Streptomyces roseirectus]|uniref:Uncharacterized protein n=1 Tax=Streptomyces roseirectus TaxID=2768066 RepID=A0A7H0IJY7_9ACTN|nr:hypothetical protein [Streptomyces roseirectus]QNP73103.1 hypothetical protein IAG44_29165 [Streptomyces roseirectus]